MKREHLALIGILSLTAIAYAVYRWRTKKKLAKAKKEAIEKEHIPKKPTAYDIGKEAFKPPKETFKKPKKVGLKERVSQMISARQFRFVVETPDKEHFKTVWVHEGSQLAKNLENQFKKQGRRYYLEWR